MQLQKGKSSTNVLGLSDTNSASINDLEELALLAKKEANQRSLPFVRRLGEIINHPNNPGGKSFYHLKPYFQSFNSDAFAIEANLQRRVPWVFGFGEKPQSIENSKPKPEPQSEPEQNNQSSTSPVPASTQAGFSFGDINPWYLGGGLAGTLLLAILATRG